jgi:hypothetical protein
MDAAVAQRLVELNRRFYADFGENFSATRQRIQPGVRKMIALLVGNEWMLDLGCGNGELARTLAQPGSTARTSAWISACRSLKRPNPSLQLFPSTSAPSI